MIQKEVGGKAPKKPMPPAVLKLAARVLPFVARLRGREPDVTPEIAIFFCMRAHIKSDKAATELGYQAVPLREMVKDAADWLKREGLLGAA
jgi:dihydroflavonol-4-reductase